MSRNDDVLIVDDDPDMVEVIELVLNSAGYRTRSAQNGQLALEAVAASMPGLILLDILMPVMDGREFARQFHERYDGDVPIVVLSAAEHLRKRSDGVDATDVLAKPFEVDDLLRIVARHLPAGQASGRGHAPSAAP